METKTLVSIISVVIGFILIFAIVGGFTNTLTDAGLKASNPNSCYDRGLRLNATEGYCLTATGANESRVVYTTLPLQTFFSPSGIIMLILFVAILIATIVFLLRKK